MSAPHRVPYIAVFVKDLRSASEFFTKHLGLRAGTLPFTVPRAKQDGEAVALALEGTTLVLVREDASRDVEGLSAGHGSPSFDVENLDAFHANAISNGVEVVQGPTTGDFGRFAAYLGPDGIVVMAVEPARQPEHHAIVLSGGGAFGAFGLGVMRMLANAGSTKHRGLNDHRPSLITGTSVGAFNAAWLACALSDPARPFAEIVEGLVDIWRHRVAGGVSDNGVFRIRGNAFGFPTPAEVVGDAAFLARDLAQRLAYVSKLPPRASRFVEAVDVSALISEAPLKQLMEETLNWGALVGSPCRLQVAATDWEQGTVRLFAHGGKRLACEERIDESNFLAAVLASTAIPGFFPPVEVEVEREGGGREKRIHVDGGLVLNSPLNPAIDAGATFIHLICLNPDVSTLRRSPVNSTVDTLERALATSVAAGVASELARVRLGNRLAGVVRREHSDDLYREVTVHRYHPQKEVLGGAPGILDFSLEHLDALIQNGEDIAKHHDCDRDKCILPGKRRGGGHAADAFPQPC